MMDVSTSVTGSDVSVTSCLLQRQHVQQHEQCSAACDYLSAIELTLQAGLVLCSYHFKDGDGFMCERLPLSPSPSVVLCLPSCLMQSQFH